MMSLFINAKEKSGTFTFDITSRDSTFRCSNASFGGLGLHKIIRSWFNLHTFNTATSCCLRCQ